MSKGYDQLVDKFMKNSKLVVLANEYANQSMWSYIEDYKDEFKKPNPVDKMRHRAIAKQCYKRAKKDLERKEEVGKFFEETVERNGDALTRLSKE